MAPPIAIERQRQLELEAEAEFEFEQEQSQQVGPAMQRAQANPLGADHNSSVLGNMGESIKEIPQVLWRAGKDIYNFVNPFANGGAGGPIDTIANSGLVNSLDTTGGLAAGAAGASAGGTIGAGIGGTLGTVVPVVGTAIGAGAGGIIGGGLGFGAGMLGYGLSRDATDITREIQPTDHYVKDFAYNATQGAALGVLGAAAKAPFKAISKGKNALGEVGAENRVVTKLKELYPDITPEQIQQALDAQAGVPLSDFKSLGELVNNDALKVAQRTVSQSTPTGKGSEIAKSRADAQLKYLDQIETSNVTPQAVPEIIQKIVDTELLAKEKGVQIGEAQVGDAVADLSYSIDKGDAGNIIRDFAKQNKASLKGEVSQKFQEAGLGEVDVSLPQEVALAEASNYYKQVGPQPNGKLVELLNDLNKTSDPIVGPDGNPVGLLGPDGQPIVKPMSYTIQDTQAMRSKALEIVNSNDARASAVASKIADALKQSEDLAIQGGKVSPAEVASLNEGRALRFKQDAIFETRSTPTSKILKSKYGKNNTVDSTVPSEYFKPDPTGKRGAKEAMQNYKKAVGESAQAIEPIERYATDSFRDFVINENGVVNKVKARKWLSDHNASLSELPDLKRVLSNVETSQTFLEQKFGDLKRSKIEAEKGAAKYVLQVDPQLVVQKLVGGATPVKNFKKVVDYLKSQDKDAVLGFRRAVIEHFQNKAFVPDQVGGVADALSGNQFVGQSKPSIYVNEWNKVRPAIEKSKLFTDSQVKGFDALYNNMQSQMSVGRANAPKGSPTFQNISVMGKLLEHSARRFTAGGYSGIVWGKIASVIKEIPQNKFTALLEEALLDPKKARDLLQKATSRNLIRIARDVLSQDISPVRAMFEVPATALPYAGTVKSNIGYKKQEDVTSKKSFPKTSELLNQPGKGKLQDSTFNLNSFIKEQSPETQATIGAESSGNPFATSPKGAQGLSQLMPGTAEDIAKELGEVYTPLRSNMSPSEQEDAIRQNVRFGEYYKNVMLPKINKAFKHPTLARAAYNAGPKRVEDAMRLAGTSTDINKILSALPKGVQKETIPYTAKIEDAMQRLMG